MFLEFFRRSFTSSSGTDGIRQNVFGFRWVLGPPFAYIDSLLVRKKEQEEERKVCRVKEEWKRERERGTPLKRRLYRVRAQVPSNTNIHSHQPQISFKLTWVSSNTYIFLGYHTDGLITMPCHTSVKYFTVTVYVYSITFEHIMQVFRSYHYRYVSNTLSLPSHRVAIVCCKVSLFAKALGMVSGT